MELSSTLNADKNNVLMLDHDDDKNAANNLSLPAVFRYDALLPRPEQEGNVSLEEQLERIVTRQNQARNRRIFGTIGVALLLLLLIVAATSSYNNKNLTSEADQSLDETTTPSSDTTPSIRHRPCIWNSKTLEPCDSTKIEALHILDHDGATTTIATSIGLWTKLTFLDLSQNALTGTIPTQLLQLTKLTVLNLAGNALTGTISQDMFTPLSQLQTLDLSDNNALQGTIHYSNHMERLHFSISAAMTI